MCIPAARLSVGSWEENQKLHAGWYNIRYLLLTIISITSQVLFTWMDKDVETCSSVLSREVPIPASVFSIVQCGDEEETAEAAHAARLGRRCRGLSFTILEPQWHICTKGGCRGRTFVVLLRDPRALGLNERCPERSRMTMDSPDEHLQKAA